MREVWPQSLRLTCPTDKAVLDFCHTYTWYMNKWLRTWDMGILGREVRPQSLRLTCPTDKAVVDWFHTYTWYMNKWFGTWDMGILGREVWPQSCQRVSFSPCCCFDPNGFVLLVKMVSNLLFRRTLQHLAAKRKEGESKLPQENSPCIFKVASLLHLSLEPCYLTNLEKTIQCRNEMCNEK